VICERCSQITWIRPLQVNELAGVEVQVLVVHVAARSYHRAPEAFRETRFVIDALSMSRKVSNEKLRRANACDDPVVDVVVVRHSIDSVGTISAIVFNRRENAVPESFIQIFMERHRHEAGARRTTGRKRV
jgi:hypothetical protein